MHVQSHASPYAVPSVANILQASSIYSERPVIMWQVWQVPETSANMFQVVHNFRMSQRICAKWCINFGGL